MRVIDLAGMHVFITGGTRGLGFSLARMMAERGARVTICGRDLATAERARIALGTGRAVDVAVADIRDKDDIERALAGAAERSGPIDVLVNNAGIIQVGPRDAATLEDYEDAMATHFWGPLYAIEAVLPDMRRRHAGRIVNISSIGGRISVPHLLPYCASKFALTGLSEGLRPELLRDGIVVTTVFPGLMRTGSPENAQFKGRNRAEYAWFATADSLPFLSVDVDEAAAQIITAIERGDAELIVSAPATVAVLARALVPRLVAGALALTARLLPPPGGIGTASRPGRESHSPFAPSALTTATQRRSITQNEVPLP
jgi:NAD(P)-dependent dehydrogenase (short-subunit alcohol dehydrogenase family)